MGGNHTIMRRVTPYVRPAAWRRVASVIVLLMSAAAAHATSPARGSIHTYAALRGKFAFVPPDGGLTVLDSATGKVLFRGPARSDERYSWNSFFDTPHGLVVRSYRWKLLTRDESVYRLRGRGALECVDAETGKGLWSYLFDAPAHGPFF